MSFGTMSIHPVRVSAHEEMCKKMFSGEVQVVAWGKHQGDFSRIYEKPDLLKIVADTAREYGVKQIFAPQASLCSRAIISDPTDYPQWIPTHDDGGCVFQGAPADGAELEVGEGLFLATGDCPTVVMRHPLSKKVVAFHAGRKSLIDEDFLSGRRSESASSVVENCLNLFLRGGRTQIHAGVFLGIGPRNFEHPVDHPVYGDFNRRMIDYVCSNWGGECFAQQLRVYEEYGKTRVSPRENRALLCEKGQLDFCALIRAQAMRCGVSGNQVVSDGICTYIDGCAAYDRLWHSNRRGDKSRNGMLVMRVK